MGYLEYHYSLRFTTPESSLFSELVYTADKDQQSNQAGGVEREKSCGGDISDSEEDPLRSLFSDDDDDDDDDDNAADLDSPDTENAIGLDEACHPSKGKEVTEKRVLHNHLGSGCDRSDHDPSRSCGLWSRI
ncbi:uncharacterized protein PADG_07397 [Paracoccidioides brasiliensis Pb18]|uniref:Uncharacterized protein n=1 Tax=Paracoccidioides brasiliensis (strain Pb18) TaxID=502780 RepID=C1GJG1_PARBD|nr:uncharacterized protein PADG_07397 [Paracoccidioides brasiliensis Pb18]EEH42577.2 hypothetical protein PADG_07397 [Paracoccidioides brasiliensis Pb18]